MTFLASQVDLKVIDSYRAVSWSTLLMFVEAICFRFLFSRRAWASLSRRVPFIPAVPPNDKPLLRLKTLIPPVSFGLGVLFFPVCKTRLEFAPASGFRRRAPYRNFVLVDCNDLLFFPPSPLPFGSLFVPSV